MKAMYAASFALAALLHGLLLFGFKLTVPARPYALSDEPSAVDVSLVAAAAEAPPAEAAPTPEPVSTPEPAPTPEPTPEMSTQPPALEETPVPEIAPASATPRPNVTHPRHNGRAAPPAVLPAAGRSGGAVSGAANSGVRYRSNPKPPYPEEARRLREEGIVLVSVEVGADGLPVEVTLKQSSGYESLDRAAVEAVKGWTFEPAREGPLPVASRVDVPVRFSLSE
jgi:protein TonB